MNKREKTMDELAVMLAKRYNMTAKRCTECRYIFDFNETNKKGEFIQVELSKSESDGKKGSLPYLWHKHGYINRVLFDWWSITVYCTELNGSCFGNYNPQVIYGKRPIINFDWMLEATEKNAVKLFDEIVKRAFN